MKPHQQDEVFLYLKLSLSLHDIKLNCEKDLINMNAKKEFIEHIDSRSILCVQIQHGDAYGYDEVVVYNLTTGWTNEDWNKFLNEIDFDYDSGYGGQEVFGVIWYVDGTWSTRGEYDGSEWWEHQKRPDIPTELNRVDKVRDKKINQIL